MRKIITLLSIGLCGTAGAQTLSPQVIASGGNYAAAVTITLSYTIGEMSLVNTASAGSVILTQGFQQPTSQVLGLLDQSTDPSQIAVYPVPASSRIWFGYKFDHQSEVTVEVYNLMGQRANLYFAERYESGKTVESFDCTDLASGQYILKVSQITSQGQVNQISKHFEIIH
jgi:Secretion system C-terminal sorting domain